MFVSDEYLNRITIYDEEGGYRYHWGRSGSGEGQLNGPSGIAFDSRGVRLGGGQPESPGAEFQPDRRVPVRIREARCDGDGDMEMPWGICIDGEDNIYVADWGNNRVQKFAPTGELLVKFESSSTGVGDAQGAFRRGRGLRRGCIRNRLGEPPRPDLLLPTANILRRWSVTPRSLRHGPRPTSTPIRISSKPGGGRIWSLNGASGGQWPSTLTQTTGS